jgi:hypothetical protein
MATTQDRLNMFQTLKSTPTWDITKKKQGDYLVTTILFNDWEKKYFANDSTVSNMYDILTSECYNDATPPKTDLYYFYSKTIKDFYEKYVCDLEWAKSTSYCGAKPTPTSGPSPTPTPVPNPINTCPATSTTGEDIVNGASVKKCVKGDIVRKIQENLKKHGFTGYSRSGNPDGIFGSRTDKTVRQFQSSKGLSVDGVVGPKTWLELVKDKSNNNTNSNTSPFSDDEDDFS